MGALNRLRAANGDDGLVGRARSSPRLLVAIAGGTVLLLAWIAWAIYVTSDHGARAGLGVVIAWPAMLAALAIISLPFIGVYLLIRRLSTDSGEGGGGVTAGAETSEAEDEPEDDESDDADEGSDDEEENGEDEEEEDEDEEDEESESDEEDSSKS